MVSPGRVGAAQQPHGQLPGGRLPVWRLRGPVELGPDARRDRLGLRAAVHEQQRDALTHPCQGELNRVDRAADSLRGVPSH